MRSIAALFRRLPKLSRFLIRILPLIVLLTITAKGQSAPSPQNLPHSIKPPIPADQEQFISYWTTETGWHSEIQLRNNLAAQDLTVTPALRTADGAETLLSPVTIKPQEVKTIDIESAVMGSAPQLIANYGSAVLRYHSPDSRNLFAMLMLRNRTGFDHSRRVVPNLFLELAPCGAGFQAGRLSLVYVASGKLFAKELSPAPSIAGSADSLANHNRPIWVEDSSDSGVRLGFSKNFGATR
jgi:hypothetical protein